MPNLFTFGLSCYSKIRINFDIANIFSKNFYFLFITVTERKNTVKPLSKLSIPTYTSRSLYISKLSKRNESTKHFNNFFTGVGNLSSSLVHPHLKHNTHCFV